MIQSAKTNPLVCFCHEVREDEIHEAITQGAQTLFQLQCEILVTTGCGGCGCRVTEILATHGVLEEDHSGLPQATA